MKSISAISPKIKLWDISPKLEGGDLAEWLRAVEGGHFTSEEEFGTAFAEADIICGFGTPKDIIGRAPNLKWIHCVLAGVEHLLNADIISSPVIVTNSRGLYGIQVSEFALQLMMLFAKKAPLYLQQKREKKWESFYPTLLNSKTVGVVGLGSIGQRVARLAKAFGMRVLAVRVNSSIRCDDVDTIIPIKKLQELLGESDYVVLAVPLTRETRNLISEAELRAMKPTAYLINVARGGIVNEDALVHAIEENCIGGAGLDVFSTEPLPANSKLWDLPNVIISPHVAGITTDTDKVETQLFCNNLKRYLNGEELLNVVNKEKGY